MNRRVETPARIAFFETFNCIMTAASLFGVLVLVELLFAPEALRPWGAVLRASPIFLAYPLGRLLRTVHPKVAISLGLASSVCLASIPLVMMFRADLAWAMMVPIYPLAAFAVFITPYINGSNLLRPRHFIIGVIFFLGDVLFIRIQGVDTYSQPVNITAVLFLCAGLFVYNRESLRSETSPDGKRAKFPKGSRRAGALTVTFFIALALALANVQALRKFFTELAISIASAVILFLDWFGRMMGIGTSGSGGSVTPSNDNIMLGDDYTTESDFVQKLWNVVLILIIIGICVAAVYILIRVLKNLPGGLSGLLHRIFGIKPEENAYVDETEDLGEEQSLGDMLKNGLKKVSERLRRPPRFEDMPNNREKVRLTYRRTLRRITSKNRASIARTPNELKPEVERIAGEPGDEFVDIYNRARYSTEEISDAEAEVAREVYRQV